ncbi:MAG: hypothetical protein A3F10_05760 [Coxiella sp. RIFCSPHIGHO2_12_FULL_42_15]|nr:MAG: hypothetical protein A3F10_05760 [Coxiella sp. RIFCSPHIGHO2_12_FULL_42_15]
MKAEKIIENLHNQGVEIFIRPDKLYIQRLASLRDNEMLNLIQQNKLEIRRILICRQYDMSIAEVETAAEEDWGELIADFEMFTAFISALKDTKQRRQGIVPPDYDDMAFCEGCQQTRPLPESIANSGYVMGCPWCWE